MDVNCFIISMLHVINRLYSNGSKSNLSHISLFTHGPKHVFNVPVFASMRTWELFRRVLAMKKSPNTYIHQIKQNQMYNHTSVCLSACKLYCTVQAKYSISVCDRSGYLILTMSYGNWLGHIAILMHYWKGNDAIDGWLGGSNFHHIRTCFTPNTKDDCIILHYVLV